MPVALHEIIRTIEDLAPPCLAESWDNIGLQVGSPDLAVSRVLLAVDVTRQVVEEAARKSADALVAHHPVLFDRVATLRPDRWPGCVVAPLVAAGRALYIAHTNLDWAPRTNTGAALARALGLTNVRRLAPTDAERVPVEASEEPSLGVLAECDPAPLGELAARIRSALGLSGVRVADAGHGELTRVAVFAGSAKGFAASAQEAGAEVLVAGEVGHHMAVEAAATGLSSIEVGHFASERPAMEHLAELLRGALGERVEVLVSEDRAGAFVPS